MSQAVIDMARIENAVTEHTIWLLGPGEYTKRREHRNTPEAAEGEVSMMQDGMTLGTLRFVMTAHGNTIELDVSITTDERKLDSDVLIDVIQKTMG